MKITKNIHIKTENGHLSATFSSSTNSVIIRDSKSGNFVTIPTQQVKKFFKLISALESEASPFLWNVEALSVDKT